MKDFKYYIATALTVLVISSCSRSISFPVSSVAPAAEIVAKKSKDKNDNVVIDITAKNLASPERLDPPRSVYNVWIVTESDGTKNVGQLMNKNAQTATLRVMTPFEVREIIITAEDRGDHSFPSGFEISRTSFNP